MPHLFTYLVIRRRPLMVVTLLLLLLQFSIKVQSQYWPGPATEEGTKVIFWDQRSFNGTDKIEINISQTDPQSVNQGINLVNRISSVSIPKGIKVTLFDGNQADKSVSKWTELYPGNYPWLGAWEDRTDFVLLEKIAVDEPVVYFYDEIQDVGTDKLLLFHGLGKGEWRAEQLLGNDRFEALFIVGLIDVTPYEHDNFQGTSATYKDVTGELNLFAKTQLPDGLFDRVSSVSIQPRTDASPARIISLNQEDSNSDYLVSLNFTAEPPTQSLCLCISPLPFRKITITSDKILVPSELTESNLDLWAAGNLYNPWQGSIQVLLGPSQQDISVGVTYDAGLGALLSCQSCIYSAANSTVSVSTVALKAPILDSFSVLGDGKIEIIWTKQSDVPDSLITTHVLRDGQQITSRDGVESGIRNFITDDFPGTGPYDYTIEIEAFDQIASSDPLRISAPIGILTGTVATRPGGLTGAITGVRDVEVCAIQEIDLPGSAAGARYCDTTDLEGNYRIENIYFGEEGSFRIEPNKPGHGFEPDFRNRKLTPQISIERMINFTDTTSFVLSGRVVQPGDTTCPVGGAEILINDAFLGDHTDTDGNFVISVPQAGTFSIRPRLAEHSFVPEEYVLLVEADTTGLLFIDTTRQTVDGYVRAGCEQFIGQAEVRIFSPDNCLDTTLTTTLDSGYFKIELPARRYNIEVLGIDLVPDSELEEGEVIGFLAKKSIDLTERDTSVKFTYRQTPKIQIRGLDGPACQDLPYPILDQLEQVQLEIEVWEEVDVCPVDTGSLIIVDRISVPNQEIEIPIQNGIARYTFEATEPNILPPYTKNLSITANVDGRLSDVQIDVIVTGVRGREKTFATVTPELPLMILRDPPGDASSSYLEQNATFQAATSFSSQTNNASKTWAKLKVGTKFEIGFGYTTEVSVWGDIGGSATMSAATKDNEEFLTTLTTGEKFSTSNNEVVTGTEGDVFMGAALNMIYALADEIRYNPANCSIETDTTLIMGNDGFATTYIYTEDHIRNSLIPQLNQLIVLNRDMNPDTVAFFQSQVSVWEQTLQRNEELKRKAKYVENKSFSGLAPYESFTSSSSTEKITIEYKDVIDTEVALEAGLEIAGVGFSLGTQVSFRMETGVSNSQVSTEKLRTGFILSDDDQGDFFSVDIKTDPVYNTPVFDLISGRSSCPYEPKTQPRDGAQLEADNLVQTNVPPDEPAVFRLFLGNTSQSEESRFYALKFNQGSNPDGATIQIGGTDYDQPITNNIPSGTPLQQTVRVFRNPPAYDFPDLEFILVSTCDTSISKSIRLSAYFQSDCSPISIQTDESEWIVSNQDNGMQSVQIMDYEKENLDRVTIQYLPQGGMTWEALHILQPADLSNLPGGTKVSLDLSNLPDGQYQLRAKLDCQQGFVYSESISGRIDRTAPQVYGQPEPIDDIFGQGKELSVTFDEPINCLLITAENIQLLRTSDSTEIPVSVGCSGDKLLFRPDQDLFVQFGEGYTIQVEEVEDLYGNQISGPVIWSFTIGEGSGIENPDFDGDGVLDDLDNCVLAANPNQRDSDEDGIGDACDEDLDGDGIENHLDNAPFHFNPDQIDSDGDGIGDVAELGADGDQDGIPNQSDNCPTSSNADQSDIDGDGKGDACDDDIDNDGILNNVDNCPTIANSLQEDVNGDGIGDRCEGIVNANNTLSFQYLQIYPNPTSDVLNVELEPSEAGRYSLELYSSFGQRLQSLETELFQRRTTLSFELGNLPSGLYFLMLSDGKKTFGKRIIVQ